MRIQDPRITSMTLQWPSRSSPFSSRLPRASSRVGRREWAAVYIHWCTKTKRTEEIDLLRMQDPRITNTNTTLQWPSRSSPFSSKYPRASRRECVVCSIHPLVPEQSKENGALLRVQYSIVTNTTLQWPSCSSPFSSKHPRANRRSARCTATGAPRAWWTSGRGRLDGTPRGYPSPSRASPVKISNG